jgi:hypothetical protein
MQTSGYVINLLDKPKIIDTKMALEDQKRAKRFDGNLNIQDQTLNGVFLDQNSGCKLADREIFS